MTLVNSNSDYAKKLKELRKSRLIKQTVMTEKLGLKSQQQYSDLESGKKQFTEELLFKICDVFNLPLLTFLQDDSAKNILGTGSNQGDELILESDGNNDLKFLIYKKLFLETKLENIELRLKYLHGIRETTERVSFRQQVFVMV